MRVRPLLPLFAFLVLTFFLAGCTAARADDPSVGFVALREAYADRTVITGRTTGVWYIADATTFVSGAEAPVTEAFIAKGNCTVTHRRNFMLIACEAHGHTVPLSADQFQMDAALASAQLDVTQRTYQQSVAWEGQGTAPDGSQGVAFGSWGVDAGVAVGRFSKASGTLYGRPFVSDPTADWLSWCFMVEGGAAGAFVPGSLSLHGATVSRTVDARGQLHYRLTARR